MSCIAIRNGSASSAFRVSVTSRRLAATDTIVGDMAGICYDGILTDMSQK